MKYFVLLTNMSAYKEGFIFNLDARDALIANVDLFSRRRILWDEVTLDAAELNGYFAISDSGLSDGDICFIPPSAY